MPAVLEEVNVEEPVSDHPAHISPSITTTASGINHLKKPVLEQPVIFEPEVRDPSCRGPSEYDIYPKLED